MARGNLKSDMATTLARATGATRAEALQTMRDMGISNDGRAERGSAADARQQRLLTNLGDPKGKSLGELASAIRRDWTQSEKGINFGARPYLEALEAMGSIKDNYGADSAKSIATYFLSNATGWKGPVAKLVKEELKRRIKSGDDGTPGGTLRSDTRDDDAYFAGRDAARKAGASAKEADRIGEKAIKEVRETKRQFYEEDGKTGRGSVKDLIKKIKEAKRPKGTFRSDTSEDDEWGRVYDRAREAGKSKAAAQKAADKGYFRLKDGSIQGGGAGSVSKNYEENADQATLKKAYQMLIDADKPSKKQSPGVTYRIPKGMDLGTKPKKTKKNK